MISLEPVMMNILCVAVLIFSSRNISFQCFHGTFSHLLVMMTCCLFICFFFFRFLPLCKNPPAALCSQQRKRQRCDFSVWTRRWSVLLHVLVQTKKRWETGAGNILCWQRHMGYWSTFQQVQVHHVQTCIAEFHSADTPSWGRRLRCVLLCLQ